MSAIFLLLGAILSFYFLKSKPINNGSNNNGKSRSDLEMTKKKKEYMKHSVDDSEQFSFYYNSSIIYYKK